MDREITFRKIAAGHYRNEETGVEIIRVPKKTIGRNGWRVAGWSVTAPSTGNGHLSRSEVGFDTTLTAAKIPATRIALATRAQISRSYVEATRSYLNRISISIQDNSEDREWDAASPLLDAANRAFRSEEYGRARAWAREALAVTALAAV